MKIMTYIRSLLHTVYAALAIPAIILTCLTSCTSENEEYEAKDNSLPICFSTPVMQGITRAAVYGEINAYPEGESFVVFGRRYLPKPTDGDHALWNSALAEYDVNGEKAAYNGTSSWETEISHYWINSFKYVFAAYSPYDEQLRAKTTYDDAKGLTISGFSCGAPGSQYDLMFTDRIYGMSKENVTTIAGGYNGINLKFRHALASVKIRIGVNPKYTTDNQGVISSGIFKIKSIRLTNIDNTASFCQNITDVVTHTLGDAPAWTGTDDGRTLTFTLLDKTSAPVDIPVISGVQDLNAATKPISDAGIGGHDGIFIPQKLDGTSGKTMLEVVWCNNGLSARPDWTTTLVELNTTEWKMGYRYTYILTFGRERIYFAPNIGEWGDGGNSEGVIK